MTKKFKTLFPVKSSLISLYVALTAPIPFISSEQLNMPSLLLFFLGLFIIINITSDYVETNDKKIYYKASFFSNIFGKKNWEISWKDIRLIKSLPTSQGSKVYYLTLKNEENYLFPQRIENIKELITLITKKTNLDIEAMAISYISPLWTYKLLSFLSVLMIFGEIIFFWFKYYQD